MKSGPPQRTDKDMIPWRVPQSGLTIVTGSKIYKSRQDRRALFSGVVVGIDIEDGDGVDMVWDMEKPMTDGREYVDHIDCVSTLEHVRRPWLAATNLQTILRPGGTLFVAVPFVWRRHGYPSDYWRMTPDALPILFDQIEWTDLLYFSQRDGLTSEYPKPTKEHPFHVPRCETYGWGVKR